MTARAHISWKTKYACALLKLGDVEYDHAKLMHEDQMISLYQVDHNKLHALDPDNHFSNLAPMLRAAHKEKSRKDTGIVAKVKRIIEKQAHARAIELMPDVALVIDDSNPCVARSPDPWRDPDLYRRRPKPRIQSRPFQKDTRPKGQRGFQRGRP